MTRGRLDNFMIFHISNNFTHSIPETFVLVGFSVLLTRTYDDREVETKLWKKIGEWSYMPTSIPQNISTHNECFHPPEANLITKLDCKINFAFMYASGLFYENSTELDEVGYI